METRSSPSLEVLVGLARHAQLEPASLSTLSKPALFGHLRSKYDYPRLQRARQISLKRNESNSRPSTAGINANATLKSNNVDSMAPRSKRPCRPSGGGGGSSGRSASSVSSSSNSAAVGTQQGIPPASIFVQTRSRSRLHAAAATAAVAVGGSGNALSENPEPHSFASDTPRRSSAPGRRRKGAAAAEEGSHASRTTSPSRSATSSSRSPRPQPGRRESHPKLSRGRGGAGTSTAKGSGAGGANSGSISTGSGFSSRSSCGSAEGGSGDAAATNSSNGIAGCPSRVDEEAELYGATGGGEGTIAKRRRPGAGSGSGSGRSSSLSGRGRGKGKGKAKSRGAGSGSSRKSKGRASGDGRLVVREESGASSCGAGCEGWDKEDGEGEGRDGHDGRVNELDPIMLVKVGKNHHRFVRPNGRVVLYNLDSLVDYFISTGDFLEPETRLPFSDEELRAIDSKVMAAGLTKPSVLDAKRNPARYTEQKFQQDALVGLERMTSELVTGMLKVVEASDREEGEIRLVAELFPPFADLFKQIRVADQHFAGQCMQHYTSWLQGPPNRPTEDEMGFLEIILGFLKQLQECEGDNSPLGF